MVRMRNNQQKPLLIEACLRFVYAKSMSNVVVLAAAEELVSLGSAEIFSTMNGNLDEEYDEAEARFRKRVGQDIFRASERLHQLVSRFTVWTDTSSNFNQVPAVFLYFTISAAKADFIEKLISINGGDVRRLQTKFLNRVVSGLEIRQEDLNNMLEEEINYGARRSQDLPITMAPATTAPAVFTTVAPTTGMIKHGGPGNLYDADSDIEPPASKKRKFNSADTSLGLAQKKYKAD